MSRRDPARQGFDHPRDLRLERARRREAIHGEAAKPDAASTGVDRHHDGDEAA
jgi:hypothetical protein